MKGEYLVIDRKDELRQHLQSEKDNKLRLKLTFLHCFMTLGVGLEELCRGFDIATSTGYEWIRTGIGGLRWNSRGSRRLSPRLDE
jgi:hypothetical protein